MKEKLFFLIIIVFSAQLLLGKRNLRFGVNSLIIL